MNKRRTAGVAVAIVLGILGANLTAGAASAVEPPTPLPGPIGNAFNLFQYMLSVKSQQLMSMQGPAAVGSWSAQNASIGAKSANQFRAGLLYGNVSAQQMAEVVPLYDPIDVGYGLGRKITPGPGTTGFRIPAFSGAGVLKTIGGVGVAVTGLQMGLMLGGAGVNAAGGLFGFDANGSVCAQDLANGNDLLATFSGQDCEAFKATQEFLENVNSDASAGLVGAEVCSLTYTGSCTGPLLGIGGTNFGRTWYCLAGTNTDAAAAVRWYLDGAVLQTGSQINYMGSSNSGPAPGYYPTACSAYPGTTMAYQVDAAETSTALGWGFYSGAADGPVSTVAEGEADPDRTLLCVITGSDGIDYSGETASFKESEITDWPAYVCPDLPEGVYAAHWKIIETGGDTDNVLVDEDADPEYSTWIEDNGDVCANQSCFLDLVTVASGLSCFGQGDSCDGWVDDPDRDTKYQCYYASQTVPIQSCFAYGATFNSTDRLAGAGYADPATGKPIPDGATSLSVDEQLFGAGARDPATEIRSCFGGTYSAFNPLEWVFKPIQCAAEWAFVPRAEVQTQMAQFMTEAWEETAPYVVFTTVGSWNFGSAQPGCEGIPLVIPAWDVDVSLVDSCDGWAADAAAVVKRWGTLLIVVAGALAIIRIIAGVIGFRGIE